jgi:hypothetical protein
VKRAFKYRFYPTDAQAAELSAESVAELGDDPGAAPAWPEQPGVQRVEVGGDRRPTLGGAIQAVAGHGRLARTAVTAVANWSQTARCSPRAAWPAGVRR